MSERILTALMHLFAIVSNREQVTGEARNIVLQFLSQQVGESLRANYLQRFEEFMLSTGGRTTGDREGKRISVNSVKVLKICTEINRELDQKQKYVVLLRLIEFVNSFDQLERSQEHEFIDTVAGVFNIPPSDLNASLAFCNAKSCNDLPVMSHFLVIQNRQGSCSNDLKQLHNDSLDGFLLLFKPDQENLIFLKYAGPAELNLNGQPLVSHQVYPFPEGSVVRGTKLNPVYYSDVARAYFNRGIDRDTVLQVRNLEYRFRNGAVGLHDLTFTAQSGNLVGIMGGSGAGKSTLLNLLNGNLSPASGNVLVNGINLHSERDKLQGVVGYIPQDDLLMEDLTVYQNLFYNSKLALGDLSDKEIQLQCNALLESLGLSPIRDLRVGDPLNKMVSGGQRKRLNIAIELIRKPAILFVDEPTSGLSSLDSENVMDLLKQLTLQGKLIFVVIHQPSSAIFKLFDQLLILDTGGYPVFYGNPSDAILYFKKASGSAASELSECASCGHIVPEQIFSIMESKVYDEFGHPTAGRKIKPSEWYARFQEQATEPGIGKGTYGKIDTGKIAGVFTQLGVFALRDTLSKLRNHQYLLITFLEAPLLAFVLSYFLKYFDAGGSYSFYENMNLPAYIFMGIIVALFMGLTVSAEEIIRDLKIRKRESFLHLSNGAYLSSKTIILFIISAIQTASYVLIGNYLFGIQDMFLAYWLMLFSVACFGNMLGLNISSAFNSVVTIYILIPFLVIPQIIFSGVMVRFDHLHPWLGDKTRVPVVGEIMASRWAFEGLAVRQHSGNRYEKNWFHIDRQLSETVYRKDFWLVKMNDKLDSLHRGTAGEQAAELLRNELKAYPLTDRVRSDNIKPGLGEDDYLSTKSVLNATRKYHLENFKRLDLKKDSIISNLEKSHGPGYLNALRENHSNKALASLVMNTDDFDFIIEKDRRYHRRFRPIMMDGPKGSFIRAPFYVSGKKVFGKSYDTFRVNLLVIWLMTGLLSLTLWFDLPGRLIRGFEPLAQKINRPRPSSEQ